MSIFYRCPSCNAEDGKCLHHVSLTPRLLTRCPFCGGPPVPFSTDLQSGFEGFGDDGTMVSAHVFCHECGAQGPHIDDLLYEEAEVKALVDKAVLLWETKNSRHLSLYQHSDNTYPRQPVQQDGGK